MIRRKISWVALVLFVLFLPLPAAAMHDVEDHWAEQSIRHLAALKILTGFEDGTFRPDDTVTRSQFAKALVSALGYSDEAEENSGYPTIYRDLPAGHWSAGFVQVATDLGLVSGYGDGTFRGDNPVSRAEIATMIVRALGHQEMAEALARQVPDFTDSSEIPEWARGYILVGSNLGAITGYEDGSFRPSTFTSRSEAATLVLRLMKERGLHYDHYGVIEGITGRSLTVATPNGTQVFALSPGCPVFRNKEACEVASLFPFDEIYIIGNANAVSFLEARYLDDVGEARSINTQARSLGIRSSTTGATRTVVLEDDAVVFLNGRPANLDDLDSGSRLYVAYSSLTGRIRMVDAAAFDLEGIVVDKTDTQVTVRSESGVERTLEWSPGVVLYLEGSPAGVSEIEVEDRLALHLNELEQIDYAEASREVSQ